MTSKIAIRGYTKEVNKKEKRSFPAKAELLDHKRLLIFDTETTSDSFQNLKFGSCIVIDNEKEMLNAIFYSPENISNNEEVILRQYCLQNNIPLLTTKEFIENILYPELFGVQTLCIGFNLPFDLSRLAIRFAEGRYAHKDRFYFVYTLLIRVYLFLRYKTHPLI